MQWIKQIGTAADDWAYDVTCDSGRSTDADSGNIYVTGYTSGGLNDTPILGPRIYS